MSSVVGFVFLLGGFQTLTTEYTEFHRGAPQRSVERLDHPAGCLQLAADAGCSVTRYSSAASRVLNVGKVRREKFFILS